MVEIARNVTQVYHNETLAIENFQKILTNISVSFFNKEEIPKNESSGDAFKLCKSIEGAKKYCPNRWKAMENWFSFARMVRNLVCFFNSMTLLSIVVAPFAI